MRDRLTSFGIKCRELRSRYNISMRSQARGLGISVPYISAIELGKRPVPDGYPLQLAQWMSLSEQETRTLDELASAGKAVVKIFPKTGERAVLAEEFARGVNDLNEQAINLVRAALKSTKTGRYSETEVRSRAALARAVFELGNKLSFDILRIVEHRLSRVDPDFFLKVVPDGDLGEQLQVYSESDGKTIDHFVCTEWFYNSVAEETVDTRFILAHEIAHWFLHRHEPSTFLRPSRTGRIIAKNVRKELEADLFAREFLMPIALVETYISAELLARHAMVPVRIARQRLREVNRLTVAERGEIKRLAIEADKSIQPVVRTPTPSEVSSHATVAPRVGAIVVPFPKASISPAPQNERKKKSRKRVATFPLLEYADKIPSESQEPASTRRDQTRQDRFFSDFGWRG